MNIIKLNLEFKNPLIPLDLNKVQYIVLHHADAKAATPEDIHGWHLSNGWSGFGYNEYIRKDGTVYIGRGDNIGAQCQNYNSKSYGICCEGDYDVDEMPQPQFDALVERIRYNKKRFPNPIDVVEHKKLFDTTCPGKNFPFNNILAWVVHEEPTFEGCVNELVNAGVISSPDYWVNHAVVGGTCCGEHVRKLIENMAKKV